MEKKKDVPTVLRSSSVAANEDGETIQNVWTFWEHEEQWE
jgi:hypothetical protein